MATQNIDDHDELVAEAEGQERGSGAPSARVGDCIHDSESPFSSLTDELQAFFAKPLVDLPERLQARVGAIYPAPMHWDALSADQRQLRAEWHDAQRDPSARDEAIEAFGNGFHEETMALLSRERALRRAAGFKAKRKQAVQRRRSARNAKQSRPGSRKVSDAQLILLLAAVDHLPKRNHAGAIQRKLTFMDIQMTVKAVRSRISNLNKSEP